MVAVTAKVPPPLRDRIDDAAEEGEPRSACLRRLIRNGLEAETDNGLGTRATLGASVALVMVGSAALSAAGQTATVAALAVGFAVAILAAPQLNDAWRYLLDRLSR